MPTKASMPLVTLIQTGESYPCKEDESLLTGMSRLGRTGIPVGCLGGGCGICRVRITNGSVRKLGPVSRAHVSVEEEAQGYTLACRVAPECAVELEVVGKLQKPFFKGFAGCQSNLVSTKS